MGVCDVLLFEETVDTEITLIEKVEKLLKNNPRDYKNKTVVAKISFIFKD